MSNNFPQADPIDRFEVFFKEKLEKQISKALGFKIDALLAAGPILNLTEARFDFNKGE